MWAASLQSPCGVCALVSLLKNKSRRAEELGNKSKSLLSWANFRAVWVGEICFHMPSVMIMKKVGIRPQEAEDL